LDRKEEAGLWDDRQVRTGIWCATAAILLLGAGLCGILAALWLALTFAWLGVAYLLDRPALLGKRVDGTYRAGSMLVLLPYLFAAAAVDRLRRGRNRIRPVVQVIGPIFFGGRRDPSELPPVITHVVDLAAELPRLPAVATGTTYESFPILENGRRSTSDLWNLVDRITSRGGVYIHCAAGRSRSVMVAACVLLRHNVVGSAEEAIATLAKRHPRAVLNVCQQQAIDEFSQAVRDRNFVSDESGAASLP
jgi:hypothetical protein